jgi:DNA polymerase III subunit delta'
MHEFYGHSEKLSNFSAALDAGKLHHGWVLAGPKGLGKAHFARRAAAMLVDPMGNHKSLIEHHTHPDIITVSRLPKDTAKDSDASVSSELRRSIGVDQIRAVQAVLTTRPGVAERRAIIIDSADDLERSAANALLKSLEEPPRDTYFLLVSHASDRLLPTIRSRCQIMRFEPLADAEMELAIRSALPDVNAADLASMLRAGAGSPGTALEFAGLDLGEIEMLMQRIVETGDISNKLRSQMADKLALKAAQPRYEAFLRRAPQIIADATRLMPADALAAPIAAYGEATALVGRALALSLDKQSVVLQMGSLLASLQNHQAKRT